MCPSESLSTLSSAITIEEAVGNTTLPSTDISQAAFKHACDLLSPAILNHSIRTYLLASSIAKEEGSVYASGIKHDLLFTSCILHDIGTCSTYDGPQRFEVEGADAAAAFLRGQGVDENDVHDVWVAIAVHTSPHIAERITELARIVREAVLADFGKISKVKPELKKEIEAKFPRKEIEKVLGDHVVEQAVRKPEKAPAPSWPGMLYRAHLAEPEWKGVNKSFR